MLIWGKCHTTCCEHFRPLHIAARYGLVSVVQQLIEKGADVYAMDNSGLFIFQLTTLRPICLCCWFQFICLYYSIYQWSIDRAMYMWLIGRDVRILRFCAHRIGQRAPKWPSCTELTKWHRNYKILHILYSSIALSSALTAATASANHLGVKCNKIKQQQKVKET